jgi:ferredoxin
MSESDGSSGDESTVTVTVVDGDATTALTATRGTVLRDLLLDHGFSPYTTLTERFNCGGRGLCATCGVRLRDGPEADHWHDRLADRFGYPRLSCQVTVDDDMTVSLVEDKRVWGGRE